MATLQPFHILPKGFPMSPAQSPSVAKAHSSPKVALALEARTSSGLEDMLSCETPDLNTARKTTRRDISMKKHAGEDFGVQLCKHNNRFYVSFVEEVSVFHGHYSPAYTIGLGFGDEIISVNKQDIHNLNEEEVKEMLRVSDNIFLEVADTPLARTHVCHFRPLDEYLGIHGYLNGEILRIIPDTPAERAGITRGRMVISVNGKSTVSMTDRRVLELLSQAVQEHDGKVTVVTMETAVATRLTYELNYWRLVMGLNCSASTLLDNDFSYLMIGYNAPLFMKVLDKVLNTGVSHSSHSDPTNRS